MAGVKTDTGIRDDEYCRICEEEFKAPSFTISCWRAASHSCADSLNV